MMEATVPRGMIVSSPIEKCLRRIVAKKIIAPFDFPLFAASAMDGYAIDSKDTAAASHQKPVSLKVLSKIFAGEAPSDSIHPGETIRIMTGAMIPSGATAVIPQEEVEKISSDTILIFRAIAKGENIRLQGEEIRRGERAISPFEIITPSVIGYLASLGIYEVPVFQEPKVALLPTGSELIRDSKDLEPGKIFESNSCALGAALKQMGLVPALFPPIADCRDELEEGIQKCLEGNDFTIISGGVSVGEKDYVRDILEELKVETLFWKVAQKPGKPLFLGKRENRFVFGLPGNPASSLVCFYEYVQPALLKWLGHPQIWPLSEVATLKKSISKKEGRTHFLRAQASREGGNLWVTPFSSQESHRMGSFAKANCLALFPLEAKELQKGEPIEIHWIDGREIL